MLSAPTFTKPNQGQSVIEKAVNDAKEFLKNVNSPDNIHTVRDKLTQAMGHINNLIPYIKTENSDEAQELDK